MTRDLANENFVSSLKEDECDILLIIHSIYEIFLALITLQSIAEKTKKRPVTWVFFAFSVTPEIKTEFEQQIPNNLNIIIKELENCKANEGYLNILSRVLLNWQGKEHVLYITPSCLAMSDFSDLPPIPDNKILCSRYITGIPNLDTDVIAFNIPLFKKQFSDYPLEKKITDDMWFAMMYKYNENLPADTVYYAEEYKRASLQTLQNAIFICYKSIKPWQKRDIPFGVLWWKQARKNKFYKKILQQCLLNEKSFVNKSKLDFTSLLESNSSTIQSLMRTYLKEAFLYLFTFGNAAKAHKENLSLIVQKISDEARK